MRQSSISKKAKTMTTLNGLTLDGANSNDLDDAIWAIKILGGYELLISISNVAKHVGLNSPTDDIAQTNLFSLYRGSGGCVKPMLPRYLSEDQLSLSANKKRDVVVFKVTLDNDLKLKGVETSEAKFTNKHRLTHTDVPDIIAQSDHPLHCQLSMLANVATSLLNKRREAGAFAIYDICSGWAVDEEGQLRKLSDAEKNIGYVIVQELMILTNEAVSIFCVENDIPIMFRNHQAKSAAPKVEEFSAELQHAFSANDEKQMELLRKRLALVAGRAEMGTTTKGHYGLNLATYSYFTSPIRRYPDLVGHRNLLAFINKEPYPHSIESIEVLAKAYNERQIIVSDEKSAHFKKEAHKKAGDILENERYTQLGEKEFYRVLKVLDESYKVPSKNLVKEILHRMSSGSLAVKSMSLLIVRLGRDLERSVREAIIGNIKRYPHFATMIANDLIQIHGFTDLNIVTESTGADDKRIFKSTATIKSGERELNSYKTRAKKMKLASQLATLDLLQQLIGVKITLGNNDKPIDVEIPKEKPVVAFKETGNPKGDLQEWCQKNVVTMPIYGTVSTGDPHKPSFATTVFTVINGERLEVNTEVGLSKKQSQQHAAKLWIETYASEAHLSLVS
jgi:ribonuclease R